MNSLDDILLNINSLYYKIKYMTPQTQRLASLYVLGSIAGIICLLLLFPVTNIINSKILIAILVIIAAEAAYLLYLNYYDGYYYSTDRAGIQKQYNRSGSTPYGEQTVREVFQDTMRHMETSGKKTGFGNDMFKGSAQFGLHQPSYYGSTVTPGSGLGLGSVVPRAQTQYGRTFDGVDRTAERFYGTVQDDARTLPRLGGTFTGRDARDASPVKTMYPLQSRQQDNVLGRRGFTETTTTPFSRDNERKSSLLFSQDERNLRVNTYNDQFSRPELNNSYGYTSNRNLGMSSPLRMSSAPKSPNLRPSISISSPLRKGYSGYSMNYGDYLEAPHREEIEDLTQAKEKSAKEQLRELGIHPNTLIKNKENCHHWLCKYLLELICKANDENIRDLNSKLGSFGLMLDEYVILAYQREESSTLDNLQPWRASVGSTQYKPITLDELINYEYSLQRGGPFWNLAVATKQSEALDLHNELRTLIKKRIYIENYFDIIGYKTAETRKHIMWRLYMIKDNFHKNFQFTFGEVTIKYPTDTQILSNIFFKYLSMDVLRDLKTNYPAHRRNLVVDNRSNPVLNEQDIYFKQVNLDGFEPQYDLVYENKLVSVLPGPDNLFYAICLFFHHLKFRKSRIFGAEPNNELMNLADIIIPIQ